MKHRIYGILLSCCLCLSLCSAAGAGAGRTLMVVPARYRVLQLAFDMNWLRSVSVVSYRGDAKTTQPLLHLWTGSDWRYLSLSEFSTGRFLDPPAGRVILVGDDEQIPAVLLESIKWPCDEKRLKTLDAAELVNALDGLLNFKEQEWKMLSRRFELNLKDVKEGKRPVNPYSIRRSELPLDIPAEERDIIIEIIE